MKKIIELLKKLLFGSKAEKAIVITQVVKEVKQEVKQQPAAAPGKPKKRKYYPPKPKANI